MSLPSATIRGMLILPPSDPRNSTLYSDWVRAFDPTAIDSAEALVTRWSTEFRKAKTPGGFVDGIPARVRELPESHRPWCWDMVGQWLCGSVGASYWGTRCGTAAARAYGQARSAEREHCLPVHVDYQRENALLFARVGALPVKEVAGHQRWLSTLGSAADSHREFVRLLVALAQGGAGLGADLNRRVRASAEAAGLGVDEDTRVLMRVFGACRATKVPDGLLDGAAKVFTRHRAGDAGTLLDLFPDTGADGGALLRMLDAAGAIDGMADGTLTPPIGLAGWISRFVYLYSYTGGGGRGITRQQFAPELFDTIERIGPRLRESGAPVNLSNSKYGRLAIDTELADALVTVGAAIAEPGHGNLQFWGERSRRDLVALAADPVLGPRLEATVHRDRGTSTTAIVRLPENPGIARNVHARIVALLERVAGGGLLDAELALAELDDLLDLPTVRALDGIEEALAALNGTGPLLRTLHAGIPDELCWPTWENAIAELGTVRGMTATWPVLTLYSDDRALALAPHGRVAEADFALPPDTVSHVVFHAGGDFLIGYSTEHVTPDIAFWASCPAQTFVPAERFGMSDSRSMYSGLGYQFATTDGRHDGERILRPGDRHGIGECRWQLSDGTAVWSFEGYRAGLAHWAEVDPATGARAESASLPAFFTDLELPEGKKLADRQLSYARLPETVTASPLGSVSGQAGYRVLVDRHGLSGYVVEGIDGRHATFAGGQQVSPPWGLARFPEDGGELLMTYGSSNRIGEVAPIRAHDGESPLWETRAFRDPRWEAPADYRERPAFPPPAFWHFLIPRDPAGSRVLRGLDTAAAHALIADRVLPPGIADPALADGVRAQADRAIDLVTRRERISWRVAIFRSGSLVIPPAAAPDSELLPALLGLLDWSERPDFWNGAAPAVTYPATLTAIAADGQFLAGKIDDTLRRMSPPAAPRNWIPLLDRIDAVIRRAIVGRIPDADRAALVALLTTWAATPFALPGEWRVGRTASAGDEHTVTASGMFVQPAHATPPSDASDVRTVTITPDAADRLARALDLLARNGARLPSEAAVRRFMEHTGVREPIARLVLDGMPRRMHLGGDYALACAAHEKMVRTKPYRATKEIADQYERITRQLDWAGRSRLLAAGIPADIAELWTEEGDLAAAERMAAVWNELIGKRLYVPEDLPTELAAVTGLDANFALALVHPDTSSEATVDMPCTLRADGNGAPRVRPHTGLQIWRRWNPYRDLATALAWALTERPVGDGGCAPGIATLSDRLRDRLRVPELLVNPGPISVPAELFGPQTYPDAQPGRVVFDNGLVIADQDSRLAFLRPAALSDPETVAGSLRTCADHGLDELAHVIHCEAVLATGLARMVDHAASTPVAAGQYEADPRHSVPDLVAEVAATIGARPDTAALYLQLLTLARPTDRNVRRWNGWTPARHKKAQTELLELGLVSTDQRARAGRTVFLPGAWTELPKPDLPLETSKLADHLIQTSGDTFVGPYRCVLPPRPLHEMFADAWANRDRA